GNVGQTIDLLRRPGQATNVVAMAGDGRIDLTWEPAPQTDVVGYAVYESSSPGGPYQKLNAGALVTADYLIYSDLSAANGAQRYYVIHAVDEFGNESADSAEATATAKANNGGTSVSGILSGTIVWTSSGSPYRLTGGVLVS